MLDVRVVERGSMQPCASVEFVLGVEARGGGLAGLSLELAGAGLELEGLQLLEASAGIRPSAKGAGAAGGEARRLVAALQRTWGERTDAGPKLDLALGAPVDWLRGRARVPAAPGRYPLTVEGLAGNVFVAPSAGVEPAVGGELRSFAIEVDANGTARLERFTESLELAPAIALQPRMGEPLPGLSAAALQSFYAGRKAFVTEIPESLGLGPTFNDKSCAICHAKPDAGGFSAFNVTFFGRTNADGSFDPMLDAGGPLHQAKSIAFRIEEFVPPDAEILAQRTTPHLFGIGLAELIEREQLEAVRAKQPADVVGRIHTATALEDPTNTVGRFGWKAHVASVLSFSAIASRDELGFTNRLVPDEAAPNGRAKLLAANDRVADPEDHPDERGEAFIDRVASFQRLLAPPPQTPRTGHPGEAVFEAIGCAECHVQEYRTERSPDASLAGGFVFRPYSDYMLHDMGALGDGIEQGSASGSEFRTAPLWGLHRRVGLLHDARVVQGTFQAKAAEAIRLHDGQARRSRDAFLALSEPDRASVVSFLGSLGRPEFDANDDGRVDGADWLLLEPLLEQQGIEDPQDDGRSASLRAIGDIDRDGDFDAWDVLGFQRATSSR